MTRASVRIRTGEFWGASSFERRRKRRGALAGKSLLFVLLCVFTVSGCSGDAGSKEEALAPLSAHSTAPTGELRFTAPDGWIEEKPTSSMRQAQYRLPRADGDPEDAEMVVFFFQGQGGSVQANIDRWVGQFTQPDGSSASDKAKISQKSAQGIPLTVVDITGTYMSSTGPMLAETTPKPDFRMLAAVAETTRGPWFFKLTGPVKTISKWEESFNRFLDTLQ